MFERFAESARLAVFFARYEALAAGAARIRPDHFLFALRHLHPEMFIAPLEPSPEPSGALRGRDDIRLSDSSKRLLCSAAKHARDLWLLECREWRGWRGLFRRWEWMVDSRHILLALMEERGAAIEEVRERLFSPGAVVPAIRMPPGLSPAGPRTIGLDMALLGARYEAMRLGVSSIRPEQLLLGLVFGSIHLRKPKAAEDLFGPIGAIRLEVEATCPPGSAQSDAPSPDAVQALAYAADEAAALGHERIGTAHLMLGLLRSDSPFPKEYLKRRGIQLTTARATFSDPDLP